MKVLFLDVDGVLNSKRYLRRCGHQGVVIDPSRMTLLKRIINATDAKIVLSTSWREHWSSNEWECDDTGMLINEIFKKYNLEILDKTPQLSLRRAQVIKEWLYAHQGIENYVVLDDELLGFEDLGGHFVKTDNYRDGLNEQNVAVAIKILKG